MKRIREVMGFLVCCVLAVLFMALGAAVMHVICLVIGGLQ